MFEYHTNYSGSTVTEQINNMFENAPAGSYCFIPGGITLTQTAGTNYYLRLRRNLNIVSNSSQHNPIYFQSSSGAADILLIQPEAPFYVLLHPEITGLKFAPSGGAGSMTYDPSNPLCNYCRDVIRINCPTGTGVAHMWLHDCYLPFGTGWGLNVIGLDGQASVYNSVFDNIVTDGGIRLDRTGDANTFRNCTLRGKTGLEYHIQDGAGEYLFENVSIVPSYGQAVIGKAGNKITMRQVYIEQQALPLGLTKIVMDLRHADNGTGEFTNALTLDGITVANMTGQTFDQLIRIGKSISPILRRINCYAVSPCTNAIKIDSDCIAPQIQGPITTAGTITTKIDCPAATKPYGVRVGPAWWNTPFQNTFNNSNHLHITKDPATGVVFLSGEFQSTTTGLPSIETVCGVPEGFGAKDEVSFSVTQGAGLPDAKLIVSPVTTLGPGVISMEGIHTNASRFRVAALWHNKDHLDILETNN